MTAVRERVERRPAAAPAVLLAVPAVAVFVPVFLVLLVLAPWWLALLVGVAAAGAVCWWSWSRATAVVRSLGRGEPADPARHARLINVVDGMCLTAGVQRPAVEVVDDPAANALIAGRNERDAILLVTSGLLEVTDRVQLEGVIAHQLAQLRDPDLAAATLTVTTAALPVLLADRLIRKAWWNGGRTPRDGDRPSDGPGGLGVSLLGPATALSGLRSRGIGDDRQTWADLDAASLTRFPPGLIGAYEACQQAGTVVHAGTRATAHLWMAPPIATTEAEGRLAERNRAFVGDRDLAERIDILREL